MNKCSNCNTISDVYFRIEYRSVWECRFSWNGYSFDASPFNSIFFPHFVLNFRLQRNEKFNKVTVASKYVWLDRIARVNGILRQNAIFVAQDEWQQCAKKFGNIDCENVQNEWILVYAVLKSGKSAVKKRCSYRLRSIERHNCASLMNSNS